jgi:cell division initiation protein
MPLSPEDIQNKGFSVTLRRGYEKEEVDGFLAEIAEAYREMVRAVSQAQEAADPYRNVGDEVTEILRAAKRSAEGTKTKAEQEATSVCKLADDKAREIREKAHKEAEAGLREARREADSLRLQAERHAVDLRRDTERKRKEILDEAVAHHQRLVDYERGLARRVEAIEKILSAVRTELDASPGSEDERPGKPAVAQAEPEAEPAREGAGGRKEALSEQGREEPKANDDAGGGDAEEESEAEDAAIGS